MLSDSLSRILSALPDGCVNIKNQTPTYVTSYLPCLWHKDIRGLDKIRFSKSTRKGKYEVSHDSCSYFLCTAWEASESKRSLSYMIHSQGMALGLSNVFWHFALTLSWSNFPYATTASMRGGPRRPGSSLLFNSVQQIHVECPLCA